MLLLLGGALLGGTCATCAGGGVEAMGNPFAASDPKVGVVEVLGPIALAKTTVEQLETFAERDEIEAVVLRVDSPGGSVGPSQEIYEAVRRTAERKPVIASMGSVAASGGFWIALGADEIYANPGTITGSIGVIVQTPDISRIAELLRFDMNVYKSAPHKDIGSPFRPPSEGDRAIFQALVDDVYAQFVDLTASRRGLDLEAVRPLADGRVLTGRRAHALGLVDGLGGLQTAARRALDLARGTATSSVSLADEAPELVYPPEPAPPLLELLTSEVSRGVAEGVAQGVRGSLRALQEPRVEVR